MKIPSCCYGECIPSENYVNIFELPEKPVFSGPIVVGFISVQLRTKPIMVTFDEVGT